MHAEPWQNLLPDPSPFRSILEQYSDLPCVSLPTLQSRLVHTVNRFIETDSVSFLRVVAPEHPLYWQFIRDLLPESEDCPVVLATNLSSRRLFGGIRPPHAHSSEERGLMHQANNGYLILPISELSHNPAWWHSIKNAVLSQQLPWQALSNIDCYPLPDPAKIQLKIVLLGERETQASLEALDPDLSQFLSFFSEFEQDLAITEKTLPTYLGLLKHWANTFKTGDLADEAALTAWFNLTARAMEEQWRVPLCPIWHRQQLTQSQLWQKHNTASNVISLTEQENVVVDVTTETPEILDDKMPALSAKAIAHQYYERHAANNYLPARALEDIHQRHILVETRGEVVGQINALTVVDMPAHPSSYGEPVRVSCALHMGDGDICDVERKVELGGNLHAKGMMIMQAFLQTALDLEHPLPYSASIVFEQSYSEIDGDSASIAELAVLVSALAKTPIKQNLAITGSVDQFGQIQSIGGVNEKIEGFFAVCQERGLTGDQGVIIPKTNLQNVCLNPNVIEAIQAKKFHIWTAEYAEDALYLLTGLPFFSDENDLNKPCLMARIHERINGIHHLEDNIAIKLLNKIRNRFIRN
jgi:Lon-like ATP-dependent protease